MMSRWAQEDDLFPLRDSLFEGIAVKIPYGYTKLLRDEYGGQSMTRTKFQGYVFALRPGRRAFI
jgi:hypothetical protein